jgi:hypothetical protein
MGCSFFEMSETRPKRSSRRLGVNSDSGGVAAGQHETQPGMYFIMCEQLGSVHEMRWPFRFSHTVLMGLFGIFFPFLTLQMPNNKRPVSRWNHRPHKVLEMLYNRGYEETAFSVHNSLSYRYSGRIAMHPINLSSYQFFFLYSFDRVTL